MHDQLALKAGGGFSARQEIYFLMCLKNPADICEANDIDRTGRSGDDRFKALPPLYSSKTHTYIALYALVFGQFFAPIFCFVFFKVCNHYTVSCYNNYLGCLDQDILIFVSSMQFSRYIFD